MNEIYVQMEIGHTHTNVWNKTLIGLGSSIGRNAGDHWISHNSEHLVAILTKTNKERTHPYHSAYHSKVGVSLFNPVAPNRSLEDGGAIQTPFGAQFDNDPGATVEEVDVEGNTPLHVAVEAAGFGGSGSQSMSLIPINHLWDTLGWVIRCYKS